jgi:hypothetical protein
VGLAFNPPIVHAGATALAVYAGTPLRTVAWALTGPGALTPLSTHTDVNGIAACKVSPVTAGDSITVTVTAGA